MESEKPLGGEGKSDCSQEEEDHFSLDLYDPLLLLLRWSSLDLHLVDYYYLHVSLSPHVEHANLLRYVLFTYTSPFKGHNQLQLLLLRLLRRSMDLSIACVSPPLGNSLNLHHPSPLVRFWCYLGLVVVAILNNRSSRSIVYFVGLCPGDSHALLLKLSSTLL